LEIYVSPCSPNVRPPCRSSRFATLRFASGLSLRSRPLYTVYPIHSWLVVALASSAPTVYCIFQAMMTVWRRGLPPRVGKEARKEPGPHLAQKAAARTSQCGIYAMNASGFWPPLKCRSCHRQTEFPVAPASVLCTFSHHVCRRLCCPTASAAQHVRFGVRWIS
jgi:hypothetical protein